MSRAEILNLSVEERIELVEEIWNSIASQPDAISLSDEHKQILDERYEAYLKNPKEGFSLHEVLKSIGKS